MVRPRDGDGGGGRGSDLAPAWGDPHMGCVWGMVMAVLKGGVGGLGMALWALSLWLQVGRSIGCVVVGR